MELYDLMKNIYGKNNEEQLIKAISMVKDQLNNLTEERMCKVYSSYLLNELNLRHVPVRKINTLEFGLTYEHEFILVPTNDNGYFLADLTFSQFNQNRENLTQLQNCGYQLMDNQSLHSYLSIISQNHFEQSISVDDMFYHQNSHKARK